MRTLSSSTLPTPITLTLTFVSQVSSQASGLCSPFYLLGTKPRAPNIPQVIIEWMSEQMSKWVIVKYQSELLDRLVCKDIMNPVEG